MTRFQQFHNEYWRVFCRDCQWWQVWLSHGWLFHLQGALIFGRCWCTSGNLGSGALEKMKGRTHSTCCYCFPWHMFKKYLSYLVSWSLASCLPIFSRSFVSKVFPSNGCIRNLLQWAQKIWPPHRAGTPPGGRDSWRCLYRRCGMSQLLEWWIGWGTADFFPGVVGVIDSILQERDSQGICKRWVWCRFVYKNAGRYGWTHVDKCELAYQGAQHMIPVSGVKFPCLYLYRIEMW